MNNFTASASEALRRVESLLPPTEVDVQIIRPLLQKLISSTRTPFLRRSDRYVVGTETFKASVGFDYIRLLLQSPNEYIYCKDVFSLGTNTKPSDGTREQDLEYRVMEEMRTNYAGADVASSYQVSLDDQAIRELKDRITTLEDAESIEDMEELEFLKEFLEKNTYRGDSQKFKDEREKARQSVTKGISNAIKKLKENDLTLDIGIHLDENIKRGTEFRYFGDWKWKF